MILNKKIKLTAACFVFLLSTMLFLLSPIRAIAADQIDLNADVRLSLQYIHDSKAVSGAAFSLYRVADVTASGYYQLTGDFKNYPVVLTELDNDQWRQLAYTLDGYVKRDQLSALDSAVSDADGNLTFPHSQSSLKPGLYLVIGQQYKKDGYTYTADPFLICLPGKDAHDQHWNYDITTKLKFNWEYKEIPDTPGTPDSPDTPSSNTLTRKVLKVWNDSANPAARPTEITVMLLQDGQIFDTVILNSTNNWRYTWNGLGEQYDWTVVEKEVSGYTVSIDKQGITYVITNTWIQDTPTAPAQTPGQSTLPQTGVLWWPVPMLLISGLFLILLGLLRRRGTDNEE